MIDLTGAKNQEALFVEPDNLDYVGPKGYWEYLQQVKPEGKHGDEFHYKTINSDMLGWIISRVSRKSVTELVSERLFSGKQINLLSYSGPAKDENPAIPDKFSKYHK